MWQKTEFCTKYIKLIYQKDGVASFGNAHLSQHT